VATVGADAGGVPDAIADGETGLLVPPGDPAALVEAITRLLDDVPFRERLAAAGLRRVERDHAWPAIAARVRALLAVC
jgi:glycosyltransferase involved in cell wall biosynthesis